MNFKQQATADRTKWPMGRSRRPACVGVRAKSLAAISLSIVADDQVAGEHIHFRPIIVDKWSGGKCSWLNRKCLVRKPSLRLSFRYPARIFC